MSQLGDLIVEHGPFAMGDLGSYAPFALRTAQGGFVRLPLEDELLNALRDELIELRKLRTNALAMAEEYERTPRPIASLAVSRMIWNWCYDVEVPE